MTRRRDPVTPEMHAAVMARDGMCRAAAIDPEHVCRDRWGTPHPPHQIRSLTVEHVKDEPMMGRRAPSDLSHLVALCWAANVGVPSKALRSGLREYLRAVAA